MRRLVVVAAAWFGAAVVLGLSGIVGEAPFLVPIVALGTIATCVVVYSRGGELRRLGDEIEPRWPILLHAVRAPIGVLILLDASRGVMPALFANRAGPGDIAVGVLAVVVALVPMRRAMVAAWCALGIADLVLAFGTAQYLLFVAKDERMRMVGELPYTLLPAFVVPVMILTHLLILRRLRSPAWDRANRASSPGGGARRAPRP